MAPSDYPRMLSHPHHVIWAGWETTTPRLQQAGWEIAAEQDFNYDGCRLVMRHQGMQCVAITNSVTFYKQAMLMDRYRGDLRADPRLTFHVVRMSWRGGLAIEADPNHMPKFSLIDAYPQMSMREIKNIEDMGIFATPLVRTQELIVDESEVSAILAKLVEAQKPEQERIRDRKRLRESREGLMLDADPQMKFHAQILSIAA
jgi:hypothetical protein